jgi:hypothetical protein
LLAFILAFIIKYYNVSETNELGYTFIGNSNLPVYIFMSVIISIFMGLTVSAEEIIKDRKNSKTGSFPKPQLVELPGIESNCIAHSFGHTSIKLCGFRKYHHGNKRDVPALLDNSF